jgi:hypothetical protein
MQKLATDQNAQNAALSAQTKQLLKAESHRSELKTKDPIALRRINAVEAKVSITATTAIKA